MNILWRVSSSKAFYRVGVELCLYQAAQLCVFWVRSTLASVYLGVLKRVFWGSVCGIRTRHLEVNRVPTVGHVMSLRVLLGTQAERFECRNQSSQDLSSKLKMVKPWTVLVQ